MCQLQTLREWSYRDRLLGWLFDARFRIGWGAKRYLVWLRNSVSFLWRRKATAGGPGDPAPAPPRAGDLVRVGSRKEIDDTLDRWGAVSGCVFLREMYGYCGGTYRVLKKAERFYDERRDRLVRCRDLYILEGLVCRGERRLFVEPCDRNCFLFWHAAWLRKVPGPEGG